MRFFHQHVGRQRAYIERLGPSFVADLRAGRQRLEDVFLRLTAITGEHPIIKP